jgi:hypothetical protein
MSEKHAADTPGMESQSFVELVAVLDPHRPIDPLAIQLDGWIMQKNRPMPIGVGQESSRGFELPCAKLSPGIDLTRGSCVEN